MSKAIGRDQAIQGIMALATNVDWDRIDGDIFQSTVIDDAVRAGAELTAFLQNRARLIRGEPKTIKLGSSNKSDLAKFIGNKGLTIWRGPANGNGLEGDEDIDQRSLDLLEVDLSRVTLVTCLKDKESIIVGEEKLKRLKALKQTIRLGGNVFLALWEDYQANKENSCLEWLRRNRGVTYVDFFGIVLRDAVLRDEDGDCCVLFFYFHEGEWYWQYGSLSDKWGADRVSLGVAS